MFFQTNVLILKTLVLPSVLPSYQILQNFGQKFWGQNGLKMGPCCHQMKYFMFYQKSMAESFLNLYEVAAV